MFPLCTQNVINFRSILHPILCKNALVYNFCTQCRRVSLSWDIIWWKEKPTSQIKLVGMTGEYSSNKTGYFRKDRQVGYKKWVVVYKHGRFRITWVENSGCYYELETQAFRILVDLQIRHWKGRRFLVTGCPTHCKDMLRRYVVVNWDYWSFEENC